MKSSRFLKRHTSTEFELDLAPLLAVMVKLVPVLLLSSAFVQVMTVETDLPQAVREYIQDTETIKPIATIQLEVNHTNGFKIVIDKNGAQKSEAVPLLNGNYDFQGLHDALIKVKGQFPEVFRIEFAPDKDIPYKEIVRMMDEARKTRDRKTRFPILDKKTNETIMTEFMFPDVVFVNLMEG